MTGPIFVTKCCLYINTAGSNKHIQPYTSAGDWYLLSFTTALNLALDEGFLRSTDRSSKDLLVNPNGRALPSPRLPQHGPLAILKALSSLPCLTPPTHPKVDAI
jgi:hypothetical protein